VTAEAVSSAPVGEAGFRLLADQLPDLIILAFDHELVLWAATGGGLRGNGWTPENFVGLRLPEIAGSTRAGPIEARARAALGGECTELEMPGYEDPTQLWWLTSAAGNGRWPATSWPSRRRWPGSSVSRPGRGCSCATW
jgi:hypothetical protein